jgi:hypothetical protein
MSSSRAPSNLSYARARIQPPGRHFACKDIVFQTQSVDYSCSYLFGYAIDLLPDAKTVKLPNNESIRILAMSVADENPEVMPDRPLYDVLPAVASQR